MPDAHEDYFDAAMRTPHASAKFENLGDTIQGEVIDIYSIDRKEFATGNLIINPKTGQAEQQLVVVVQTGLRGWTQSTGLKDSEGHPVPPDKDDGTRALYFPKGTNIYGAFGRAIQEAGEKSVKVGALIGVKFVDTEDTGKGNPLKKYLCRYKAPAKSMDFEAPPQQAAQQSTPAPQAPASDPWAAQQQAPASDPWAAQQQAPASDPWPVPPTPARQAPASDPWAVGEEPPF